MDGSVFLGDNNAASALPHANHPDFFYYTKLDEDGKIDPESAVVRFFAEAKIGASWYEAK